MTDYNELVKALRFCFSPSGHGCGWCPYKDHKKPCDAGLLAADAIEALQKDLATLQKCYEIADTTADEVLKQLPKRGEWVVKGANRIDCSVCGHSVCFAFGLSEGSFDLYKYCPECGAKMEVQE